MQGDQDFVEILCAMGCEALWNAEGLTLKAPQQLKGIYLNMKDLTDLVPALVIVAMFAKGATVITGIDHMRYKECDRIAVLCIELRKIGLDISFQEQKLVIEPGPQYRGNQLSPHGDHRMAMAFSVLGTRVPGTIIEGPSCVDKTFPEFYDRLADCY